ncbi:MAG TPA: MFS transporter [Stellaceae bacterium]|nr:MFS transporter [Stellaceae bacterium]
MKSSRNVDVSSVIDNAKLSPFQLRVFGLLIVVNMLDGYDTQAIAYVAPTISSLWRISPAAFGSVFSIGLLGTVIGTITFGMLADRVGRRSLIIASMVIFGCLTFVSSWSTSYPELVIYRFFIGIGLGGAVANIPSLAAEYAPERLRTTVVTASMCGFPIGAVVGGLFTGPIIEHFGWQGVFRLGAILPLLGVPVLLLLLPESVRYMTLSDERGSRIAKVLRRIDRTRTFSDVDRFYLPEPPVKRGSVVELFRNGLGTGTVLLWAALFSSLVLTYFLINWIPLLLQQAGLSVKEAVLGTVTLNFAGLVGSFFVAISIRRRPLFKLAISYTIGALSVVALGMMPGSFPPIITCIFCAGFFVIGAQLAVNAYITGYYPTAIRATGMGWAQGVGRSGSLLGPLVGSYVFTLTDKPSQMFFFSAVPALTAATALLILRAVVIKKSETKIISDGKRKTAIIG